MIFEIRFFIVKCLLQQKHQKAIKIAVTNAYPNAHDLTACTALHEATLGSKLSLCKEVHRDVEDNLLNIDFTKLDVFCCCHIRFLSTAICLCHIRFLSTHNSFQINLPCQ